MSYLYHRVSKASQVWILTQIWDFMSKGLMESISQIVAYGTSSHWFRGSTKMLGSSTFGNCWFQHSLRALSQLMHTEPVKGTCKMQSPNCFEHEPHSLSCLQDHLTWQIFRGTLKSSSLAHPHLEFSPPPQNPSVLTCFTIFSLNLPVQHHSSPVSTSDWHQLSLPIQTLV